VDNLSNEDKKVNKVKKRSEETISLQAKGQSNNFVKKLKRFKYYLIILVILTLLISTQFTFIALRVPGLYKTIHFYIIWSDHTMTETPLNNAPSKLFIYTRSDGPFGMGYDEVSSYSITHLGYRTFYATAKVRRFALRDQYGSAHPHPPDSSDNPVVKYLDNLNDGSTVTIYYQDGVYVEKPNIYLYSDIYLTDTVTISIPHGYATVTDPVVPLGSTISWDISLSPEGLFYEGEKIPWLFYELEVLTYPPKSDYGYSFEMKEESIAYNNIDYSFTDFRSLFKSELERIGLFPQESLDFVDWWFNDSMILFPEVGSYNLFLIENDWIEEELVLSTIHDYDELRLFFLCEKGEALELKAPSSIPCSTEGLILHEWGVIPT
jgi:hypothetical protein